MLDLMDTYKTLKVGGEVLSLSKPIAMGILNITPDSFFDGGKYDTIENALKQCSKMLKEGAKIIDIGANSSRPGSIPLEPDQEIKRILPVLDELFREFPKAIISVDTFRAQTAQVCIEKGVQIINDISAGDDDPEMLNVVAGTGVSYIAMHKQGSTEHMQDGPNYQNVIIELVNYFKYKLEDFNRRGIYNWVLDPGFGFGKRVEDNYSLLKHLEVFKSLFREPILAGVSRKSMINKVIKTKPDDALNGTTALNMVALMNGASILRVHDVKEAIETIALYESVINAS